MEVMEEQGNDKLETLKRVRKYYVVELPLENLLEEKTPESKESVGENPAHFDPVFAILESSEHE